MLTTVMDGFHLASNYCYLRAWKVACTRRNFCSDTRRSNNVNKFTNIINIISGMTDTS